MATHTASLPTDMPPLPAGADHERTTVMRETVTPAPALSWFSANLRNMIAVALTLMVCVLCIRGEHDAIVALMGAFSVLMGSIWGERAALKRPGTDG